jgi:hypothetical protein
LRITAAGVTPLDHTILSGQYPRAKAPLVLGGEGAAVGWGGRWIGLSGRFTRDVYGAVRRFGGWRVQ